MTSVSRKSDWGAELRVDIESSGTVVVSVDGWTARFSSPPSGMSCRTRSALRFLALCMALDNYDGSYMAARGHELGSELLVEVAGNSPELEIEFCRTMFVQAEVLAIANRAARSQVEGGQ